MTPKRRTTVARASTAKRRPVRRAKAVIPPPPPSPAFRTTPLTPALWPDLERLFGANGACAGCWCMVWRLPRAEYEQGKGEGNRLALHHLVQHGPPPGVLAFDGDVPIGWCAIAPRSTYVALERSRVLKPLDSLPVWSVSCFFVARPWRARGVATALLRAAVDFARQRGARAVEGYPMIARRERMPDAFAWTGLPGVFRAAGFRLAGRHSPARPIYRFVFED